MCGAFNGVIVGVLGGSDSFGGCGFGFLSLIFGAMAFAVVVVFGGVMGVVAVAIAAGGSHFCFNFTSVASEMFCARAFLLRKFAASEAEPWCRM